MRNSPTRITRRHFLQHSARVLAAGSAIGTALGQVPGDRPALLPDVSVLNPRGRVPVGLIIDDSTALANLNRFAMPQFDTAFGGGNASYQRDWREWPVEIPDSFVRKFGEWSAEHGIKGKYSMVPYPACVGRLDRMLPGWTQRELNDSLELVRKVIMPNWDIHPEVVTHTRVIDLKTGHPFPDHSLKFMENWEWSTGRSADEIASYMAYGLGILKDAGLTCEGITTPGGFGNKALPQLSVATGDAVRSVFQAEIPHYFRHLYDSGETSVAPRVENAGGLDGPDPRCVVSIIGCTGDWTGGWDCVAPEDPDRFITEDLQRGRMVEVIGRGEPALMVCHWTGIYWNGQELGFKVFQEVVRRLHARYDNLIWMKLSEVSRYWAAKELTTLSRTAEGLALHAPFACPDFTIRVDVENNLKPEFKTEAGVQPLSEVAGILALKPGTWTRGRGNVIACLPLPRGKSQLLLNA